MLQYTDDALRDLDAVFLYGAQVWGFEQALERHNRLYEVFDLIAENAEIGTDRQRPDGNFRRFFVHPHYIYYRVFPGVVEISRIVHQRQDPFT